MGTGVMDVSFRGGDVLDPFNDWSYNSGFFVFGKKSIPLKSLNKKSETLTTKARETDLIVSGFETTETLISKPFDPISQFKREIKAFEDNLETLLLDYKGKFVAIVGGEVIDYDEDEKSLVKRTLQNYKHVPMYIQKVEKEIETIELPSPELI